MYKDYRAIKPYKILKPIISNNYYRITLSKNGITKMYTLHRIIAITFIPNPEHKTQINHKDGNKLNNNVNNLEWCTISENMIHAYKHNLMKNTINSTKQRLSKPVSQYTKDGVFIKTYKSITEANQITGIHYSNIGRSCRTHLLAGGYKWYYGGGD